jgi:hypothetical protein
VCKKEDLCVQIRFLCRLHRGWTGIICYVSNSCLLGSTHYLSWNSYNFNVPYQLNAHWAQPRCQGLKPLCGHECHENKLQGGLCKISTLYGGEVSTELQYFLFFIWREWRNFIARKRKLQYFAIALKWANHMWQTSIEQELDMASWQILYGQLADKNDLETHRSNLNLYLSC